MADTIPAWLVLEDGAGEYYLLDPRLLEEGRVPPERRELIDRLLAAGDTSGFLDETDVPLPSGILRAVAVLRSPAGLGEAGAGA